MSTSFDATTSDRFRSLLQTHRGEWVQQREEALAECAQSVPDPVAQRRSGDLQATIARSTRRWPASRPVPTAPACSAAPPSPRSGWNCAPSPAAVSPAPQREPEPRGAA